MQDMQVSKTVSISSLPWCLYFNDGVFRGGKETVWGIQRYRWKITKAEDKGLEQIDTVSYGIFIYMNNKITKNRKKWDPSNNNQTLKWAC